MPKEDSSGKIFENEVTEILKKCGLNPKNTSGLPGRDIEIEINGKRVYLELTQLSESKDEKKYRGNFHQVMITILPILHENPGVNAYIKIDNKCFNPQYLKEIKKEFEKIILELKYDTSKSKIVSYKGVKIELEKCNDVTSSSIGGWKNERRYIPLDSERIEKIFNDKKKQCHKHKKVPAIIIVGAHSPIDNDDTIKQKINKELRKTKEILGFVLISQYLDLKYGIDTRTIFIENTHISCEYITAIKELKSKCSHLFSCQDYKHLNLN